MAVDRPADLDAVRASYDAVADNYVAMVGDPGPWHRAALEAFAEQVRGVGLVLDAGCGPGRIAGFLRDRGVEVAGIDLSPRMIDHAREQRPDITFDVASVTDVELAPRSLGGVLGWWSWFNLPRDVLPAVVARMADALRPGGLLLIGTHRGEGDVERTRCYGDVPVAWTTHLYEPDELVEMAVRAGLEPWIDLRIAAEAASGPAGVVICARRPGT
ncbi:MAG: class I SAM-dependent methyltransferase [Gordonia paraffinivorans]